LRKLIIFSISIFVFFLFGCNESETQKGNIQIDTLQKVKSDLGSSPAIPAIVGVQ
jgi:hypothetical protein